MKLVKDEGRYFKELVQWVSKISNYYGKGKHGLLEKK